MESINQQSDEERMAPYGQHLVDENHDDVEPTGVDDKSMGEEGNGDDYLGKSNLKRKNDE
ncbi:hypothetical protein [Tellurirhabdus bombi]|uniref:hypothetical protein n=1 Tax=Tellurirhabdus bombi TaxID=2907205 RepID=UPI001F3E8C3A|nr:hypothetical protein [Tellurirhabdus bombi]